MPCDVYKERGICIRNHRGAEPPRDPESPGLVRTVGWRNRASTWHGAADRVEAPARAARGRFRGSHGGRTAPSLPAEARTASGDGCLARSVPSVLVRSPGCARTPSRPHGSINTNEKEDKEEKVTASRAVRTGSGQRSAGTKGRREVDARSRQRTAPLAGKSLAGDHRPSAAARVGALRRRSEPGYGWTHGEAHHGGSAHADGFRNDRDASRRAQGAGVHVGRLRYAMGTRSLWVAARA